MNDKTFNRTIKVGGIVVAVFVLGLLTAVLVEGLNGGFNYM